MGKDRYLIWYKSVHGLSDAAALDKWKVDFGNPEIAREMEDNEWKVWVKEDTKLENVESLGKKKKAGLLVEIVVAHV